MNAPADHEDDAAPLPLRVALHLCEQAPELPAGEDFERLFTRAWLLAPEDVRPDPGDVSALAVDLLIVGDEEIAELNAQHMNHEGPTDVLSFPMGDFDPEREAFFLGEIVVSYDTARREAEARGLSFYNELARYAVHGFLHLLGYEDDTPAKRKAMAVPQERALREAGPV